MQSLLHLPDLRLTVRERFENILAQLDNLAATNSEFGDSAYELRDFVKDHAQSVVWLFELVRRREHHPRVRWFAIEVLTEYEIPGLIELLVDALEEWPEDMALLGASVGSASENTRRASRTSAQLFKEASECEAGRGRGTA